MADPTTADLEELVKALYRAETPTATKNQTQEFLSGRQRTPQGWLYATSLLASDDAHVRFFGASTLAIKVKNDLDSLNPEDHNGLRATLLLNLIGQINQKCETLVIWKLCSALAAYTTQAVGQFPQSVADLARRLAFVQAGSSMQRDRPFRAVLEGLSIAQVQAVLWYATALAEEAGSCSSNLQSSVMEQILSAELSDIVIALQWALGAEMNRASASSIPRAAIGCYRSLCRQMHTSLGHRHAEFLILHEVMPQVLSLVNIWDDASGAGGFVVDALEHFPEILDKTDTQRIAGILSSAQAEALVNRMVRDPMGEFSEDFLSLLMSYGNAAVKEIARAEDEPNSKISHELLNLMSCLGAPGFEDPICTGVINFWMTYSECLQEAESDPAHDPSSNWLNAARQRLWQVISWAWKKIWYPSDGAADKWSPDQLNDFKGFRLEVQELMQAAHVAMGAILFSRFADLAIGCLRASQWSEAEASVFALNAMSETCAEGDITVEAELSKLFASPIFGQLDAAPAYIRLKYERVRLRMVETYSDYFHREPRHLPQILNSLFQALSDPDLATTAARVIKVLSSTCRSHLTAEIGTFMTLSCSILAADTLEHLAKQDFLGAVTSVIQALPGNLAQVGRLKILLEHIEKDIRTGADLLNINPTTGSAQILNCLHYLVEMGKALKSPDDITEDSSELHESQNYWLVGDGHHLQSNLVKLIGQIFRLLHTNRVITEAVCQILRSGYSESKPGLFVFSPRVTADFVQATTPTTGGLEYVFNTAAVMLGKQSNSVDVDMQSIAYDILDHARRVTERADDAPPIDPDMNTSLIDLMAKSIPRYLKGLIMVPRGTSDLFVNAMRGLMASETPQKATSAHFWAVFVQWHKIDPELGVIVDGIVEALAPQLCQELIFQIAGTAMRSQLDSIAEPLKKLLFYRTMLAKRCITQALESPDFPNPEVTLVDRRVFLKKLLTLRGSKVTNCIIKEFWIVCKGNALTYA